MRSRLTALRARIVAAPLESWITAAVVVGAVAFTFAQLHPNLIFRNTTPTGGDMGAHVWSGTYLRDHLLPHGRLSGWTPDWYAGAPAFQFYMVVPFLAILVLDIVLPYAVAFKLIVVSGVVLMPAAAWAFGKLAGLRFPGPPMLAAATVFFLFDSSFTIYGGNIASTMAGEFAFAISLSLALVYLGVVARGLQTGRHRALAAVLLALVGLCHLIPALFAVVGTVVMVGLRARRASVRWVLTVAPVAGLLGAFWALPFVWRRSYMNDMGWEKIQPWSNHGLWTTDWWARVGDSLWPWDNRVAWLLALVAVAGGIAGRKRPHLFLTIMTVLAGVAFVLLPQGRLWNARLLPFYYLGTYLLAALGVVEIARALAARLAANRPGTRRTVLRVVPVAAVLLTLAWVGMELRTLPFGHTDSANEYHWMGLTSREDNFVDGWARWNFTGYEGRKPTVDGGGYHEYRDLIETMKVVGAEQGCGRAMWEYEPELVRYGTPMALMLLPHWTDGCIGSMEGLYFESSATTPFHFLNQSELSAVPSRAQRDLPYGPLDVRRGVEHLQLMGVTYYLTTSETARAQAADVEDLTEVATSGPWTVFEVAGSDLVVPLVNQPAVLTDVGPGQGEWLEPAVEWYLDAPAHDVLLAADGPPEWPRIEAGEDPPAVPVESVEVTNIEAGDDRISFDVDQIGQPVLVRASYFPNWDASGAQGPYRVTPNLMVVVPTDTHVELHYGWTPVDLIAWLLTLLGIGGVVLLARRPDLDVPAPPVPVAPSVYGDDPPDVLDEDPDSGPGGDPPDHEHEPAEADEENPAVPHEVPVGAGD
jgi:hypothetical protein